MNRAKDQVIGSWSRQTESTNPGIVYQTYVWGVSGVIVMGRTRMESYPSSLTIALKFPTRLYLACPVSSCMRVFTWVYD